MNENIKNLDSEELYQLIKTKIKNQKEKSNKIKNIISQDYTYTQEEIYCSKKFITFDNNNLTEWVSTSFKSNMNDKKILSPKIKGKWGTGVMAQKRAVVDITNLIFCSNEDINYKIVNNILKSTVILKGESDYWIFLHSKGNFDDETVVILFSKSEFSKTVTMSLGLFVQLENDNDCDKKFDDNEENVSDNEYCFRIFHTMQLIKSYNYDEKNNFKYENTDSCTIKILIVDDGNEKIKVSAWMNEGDAENQLVGNFCKPVSFNKNYDKNMKTSSTFELNDDNYKIMIAGSGQQCKVMHFSCETNFKDNFDYINGCKTSLNSCNCCSII